MRPWYFMKILKRQINGLNHLLVGGWTPIWKICWSNWDLFLRYRGEHTSNIWNHHQRLCWATVDGSEILRAPVDSRYINITIIYQGFQRHPTRGCLNIPIIYQRVSKNPSQPGGWSLGISWTQQPLNHHHPPPPEANVGNLWFESEPSCWQPYPHRPGRLFGKLNELRGFCRLDFLPVGFHLIFNSVAWNKPRLAPKKRGSSYPIQVDPSILYCV